MTRMLEDRHRLNAEFLEQLEPVFGRLESFSYAMTRTPEEARDLVCETVLHALEGYERVRDRQAFLAYLMTIARRLSRRRRWRSRMFSPLEDEHASQLRSGSAGPDESVDIALLHGAINSLPATLREAIVLREISGLSIAEIASVQGSTPGAVKVRLARARRRLARLLGVGRPQAPEARAVEPRGDEQGASGLLSFAARHGGLRT